MDQPQQKVPCESFFVYEHNPSRKDTTEVKCKSVKRTFITEKEFLEFTLSYQKVLSERDANISVREKLESLCREDDSLNQLKDNEMSRNQLKQMTDHNALMEQRYKKQLKQKSLELQIVDLKIRKHEEKLFHEQSQMRVYAEQVSQLLSTEKNLRLLLIANGDMFQQFQDALMKRNEVFESFKNQSNMELK